MRFIVIVFTLSSCHRNSNAQSLNCINYLSIIDDQFKNSIFIFPQLKQRRKILTSAGELENAAMYKVGDIFV